MYRLLIGIILICFCSASGQAMVADYSDSIEKLAAVPLDTNILKAEPVKSTNKPDKLFSTSFYIAPEIWSKVGDGTDSKIGLGLGGMFGITTVIDDMTIVVGPHFGFNSWSADYSKKTNSATDSVFFNLMDLGLEIELEFDNEIRLLMGFGSMTISGGYVVSGKTIMYPQYDNTQFSYTSMGCGFKIDAFFIDFIVFNYADLPSADRIDMRCGMSF